MIEGPVAQEVLLLTTFVMTTAPRDMSFYTLPEPIRNELLETYKDPVRGPFWSPAERAALVLFTYVPLSLGVSPCPSSLGLRRFTMEVVRALEVEIEAHLAGTKVEKESRSLAAVVIKFANDLGKTRLNSDETSKSRVQMRFQVLSSRVLLETDSKSPESCRYSNAAASRQYDKTSKSTRSQIDMRV